MAGTAVEAGCGAGDNAARGGRGAAAESQVLGKRVLISSPGRVRSCELESCTMLVELIMPCMADIYLHV